MCSIWKADTKVDPRSQLLPYSISQVSPLRMRSQSYDKGAFQFTRHEHLLLLSPPFRVYCYSVAICEYTPERSQIYHLRICASSQRYL